MKPGASRKQAKHQTHFCSKDICLTQKTAASRFTASWGSGAKSKAQGLRRLRNLKGNLPTSNWDRAPRSYCFRVRNLEPIYSILSSPEIFKKVAWHSAEEKNKSLRNYNHKLAWFFGNTGALNSQHVGGPKVEAGLGMGALQTPGRK